MVIILIMVKKRHTKPKETNNKYDYKNMSEVCILRSKHPSLEKYIKSCKIL